MKKTAEILLNNTNNINKSFNNVFSILDFARNQKGFLKTPEYVQFPRSLLISTIGHTLSSAIYNSKHEISKAKSLEAACAISRYVYTFYNWRIYKKIYSFDKDLAAELIEQADDMDVSNIKVPYEILMHLPFDGMYIEAKIDDEICGTFVHLDKDPGIEEPVLCFTVVKNLNKDKGLNLKTILADYDMYLYEGKTIGECMELTTKRINDHKVEDDEEFSDIYEIDAVADRNQKRIMNLLLYILSSNAEIDRNKEHKQVYKERKPDEPIKDKFREIDVLDVGIHIGSSLRKYKNKDKKNEIVNESNEIKTGSSKRPHARRGHWHHFWTGKKNNLDGRRLVLKWIPPIFINGYNENLDSLTITPVE